MKPFPDNEALLLEQIADGDQDAFRELFHRYKHKIYTIAIDFTGSAVIAEDVLQDVFLKIWLRRTSLREVTHFRAYLFTATRNHIMNILRKERSGEQQSAEVLEQESDEGQQYHGERYVMEKEYGALLVQAVNRLPLQQARAYRLITEEGYKREDAAREMGVSQETVKTHLAQAMRNIRAFCMAHLEVLFFLFLTHPFR